MIRFATNFRRIPTMTSVLWCFIALILTAKFEFGSCADSFTIEDPTFEWDGFRLNIDYQISDSIVAERITHDIVSDEDCLGGIIDDEEIESELIETSDTSVRISLLMNPESIHASRYVSHYDDYAIVGICAQLFINKPENDKYEPATANRDDYMMIKADLEELKGIEEIIDDKAKNWGVDVYQCDYNNNRQTNPPAIRNGEKLRLCLEPTQKTIDDGVFLGTIKSFHFERDGVLQKSVATYGTDDVTNVLDCHRGSNRCVIESVLKNDFFFSPGEVKGEGLIYLQWGSEEDRKRHRFLRSVELKMNTNLNLAQEEKRSLYEWYEKGEIVSEKSSTTMIKVEPINKVYKAEAFACDDNNKPNRKTMLNETEVMKICIQPDKEAKEAGVFVNSLESFSYGLANDDKTQEAIDSYGRASNDNKTIVDCSIGADVCSLSSTLRSWFFDESAPMVASGYAILQYGSQRRRAQISLNGLEFAGRHQVVAYFDTIGRNPEEKIERPVKNWFEDLFDQYNLSQTHLTILYVVAVVLLVLLILCCCAGCIFFFWYERGAKQEPNRRSQHIDIKINRDGKDISNSEFQDERSLRRGSVSRRGSDRGSQSNTEDDDYSTYYPKNPSRRGSNRGSQSNMEDDDYNALYSQKASRRGSNRGSQSNTDNDDIYNSSRSKRTSRRDSNRGSQSNTDDDDIYNSSRSKRASRRGSNRGSQSNTEDDDIYNTSRPKMTSRRGSNRGSQSNTEDYDIYNSSRSKRTSRRGSNRGSQSNMEDDGDNSNLP